MILRVPPQNRRELFKLTKDIVMNSPHNIPENSGYGGSGGPGMYLEHLLGLTMGNRDIPDSLGWELKTYSQRTNYITLFHKEPRPRGIVNYLVKNFGWIDKNERLSFRHTISRKTDRFEIVDDVGQITIRSLIDPTGPVPYWTDDDILGSAGAKLRRLLLVRYSLSGNQVSYDQVMAYEGFAISQFKEQVVNGTVLIDFDAREARPGSVGLRNHGTKFRISPNDIYRLYEKKEKII